MKILNSSKILIWMLCLFSSSWTIGQNVHYSLGNPSQSFNGTDSIFEVDILISSIDAAGAFIVSSGQIYLNYNTAVLGSNIVDNGKAGLFFDNSYLLGLKDNNIGAISVYGQLNLIDNTPDRISFAWQQDRAGACISQQVTTTPQKLVRLQLAYLPGMSGMETGLCYETSTLFRNQTYTVCGPFDECNTFPTADCAGQPGDNITNDSFSCSLGPADTPPVANTDTPSVDEDGAVVIDVLANDSDAEDTLLPCDVSIVNSPGNGTLTVGAAPDCEITYTPNSDYSGSDMFTYEICDAGGLCAMGSVLITINEINDPPVANNDTASTDENTQVSILVADNDTDLEDGTLNNCSVTLLSQPANGTATLGAGPACDVIYTPNQDYCIDTPCDPAVPVWEDMRVLFANNTCANAGCHGTKASGLDLTSYIGFTEGGDQCGNSISSGNTLATIIMSGTSCGAETVPAMNTYAGGAIDASELALIQAWIDAGAPEACDGPDTFVYQVCDSEGECATAEVAITVNCVNAAPIANDDVASGPQDTDLTIDLTANDVDDDPLDPCNATLQNVPPATVGTFSLDQNDCTLTFTPALGFTGTATLSYELCDPSGACDQGSITLDIFAVDSDPVAADDLSTTDQDTPVAIAVLDNDSDADGPLDPCLVTVVNQPANGTVSFGAPTSCTLTYTPAAGFDGTDSFVYEVCDSGNNCDQASVTITVNNVIPAPVAVDDFVNTQEETAVLIDVSLNDSNVTPCDIAVTAGPANGSTAISGCVITYTPNTSFSGIDTFIYTATTAGGTAQATVTVDVIGSINEPPVANDDLATTIQDTPVDIDVVANDSDSEDGTIPACAVSIVSGPSNGSVSILPNTPCTLTYSPTTGYTGADNFVYQVCDLDGACDTAMVGITVNSPANTPPVANDDSATTAQDNAVAIDVVGNDSDAEDGTLPACNVTVVNGPTNGSISILPNTPCTLTYTPTAGYSGADNFVYQVCDSGMLCSTAQVSITVTPPANTPPVANDDTATTAQDNAVAIDVVGNDSDAEDGTLPACNVTIVNGPTNGSVSILPNTPCTLTYTPTAGYSGADNFVYQVCDSGTLCSTAQVSITVTPPTNTPPVANDDSALTETDQPIDIDVVGNDSDAEDGTLPACNVTVVNGPSNGSVSILPNTPCTLTYTPTAGYSGADNFVYQVCDSGALCSTALVSIIVQDNSSPAVAVDDTANGTEDTVLNIDVVANDDPGTGGSLDPCAVTIVSGPSNGTAVLGTTPDCDVVYTPAQDYNGQDTFVYQICDSANNCSTATVSVNVAPVNDLPVANADQASTDENPVNIDLAGNDTDVEDGSLDPCNVTIVTPPASGSVTIAPGPNCTLTYIPVAGFSGTETFGYSICDADMGCATAIVTVTVTPTVTGPVAVDDIFNTPVDIQLMANVLSNDQNIVGGEVVTLLSDVSNGTLTLTPNGGVIYQPTTGYIGLDNFTYQVCSGGLCDNASVTISVGFDPGIPTLSEWGLILLTLLLLTFATQYIPQLEPKMATVGGKVNLSQETSSNTMTKTLVTVLALFAIGLVLVMALQGFVLPIDVIGTLISAYLITRVFK